MGETSELEVDDSGVRPRSPATRAQRLVASWRALHAYADRDPAAVRSLAGEIRRALDASVLELVSLGRLPATPETDRASDAHLDATYVLERLEWCVLHNVPYVDRPRVAV